MFLLLLFWNRHWSYLGATLFNITLNFLCVIFHFQLCCLVHIIFKFIDILVWFKVLSIWNATQLTKCTKCVKHWPLSLRGNITMITSCGTEWDTVSPERGSENKLWMSLFCFWIQRWVQFGSAQICWMNEKSCFLPKKRSLDSPVLLTEVSNHFPFTPSLNAQFFHTWLCFVVCLSVWTLFFKSCFLFCFCLFFPFMLTLRVLMAVLFFF